MESVGVDHFAWKWSRSRSRQNFANSDSGLESQDNTRQQTIIFAERLGMCRPENIERQEEKESGSVEIKLERHFAMKLRLIIGVGDNFRVIAIVV